MKSIILKLLPVCLTILLLSCNQGDQPVIPEELGLSSDTLALVDEHMQAYIDDGKLSGITVVLIKNGVEVKREEYGYADMENQTPTSENTIYRIFSMTKPVTAAALMTLYDEGKFELDDRVSEYIPAFTGTEVYTPTEDGFELQPQVDEMTIRNLLTHTSGIVYGWAPDSYVDSLYTEADVANWDAPIDEKVEQLAPLPLKFQPGTQWEYGLSIDVAGYLIEVLSGVELDEFFQERLFDPLSMDDTRFYVPEEKLDRFAHLYYADDEGNLQDAADASGVDFNDLYTPSVTHFSGGGGLVSTADDYAKFCMMMLNGGELDGARILETSSVAMIMSDQLPEGASYNEGYGYGLAGAVNLEDGEYSWAGAAATNFWIDPANEMILMAFTQLMPSDHTYAYEFRNIVRRALMD